VTEASAPPVAPICALVLKRMTRHDRRMEAIILSGSCRVEGDELVDGGPMATYLIAALAGNSAGLGSMTQAPGFAQPAQILCLRCLVGVCVREISWRAALGLHISCSFVRGPMK
jgi:hypothetical protein